MTSPAIVAAVKSSQHIRKVYPLWKICCFHVRLPTKSSKKGSHISTAQLHTIPICAHSQSARFFIYLLYVTVHAETNHMSVICILCKWLNTALRERFIENRFVRFLGVRLPVKSSKKGSHISAAPLHTIPICTHSHSAFTSYLVGESFAL